MTAGKRSCAGNILGRRCGRRRFPRIVIHDTVIGRTVVDDTAFLKERFTVTPAFDIIDDPVSDHFIEFILFHEGFSEFSDVRGKHIPVPDDDTGISEIGAGIHVPAEFSHRHEKAVAAVDVIRETVQKRKIPLRTAHHEKFIIPAAADNVTEIAGSCLIAVGSEHLQKKINQHLFHNNHVPDPHRDRPRFLKHAGAALME